MRLCCQDQERYDQLITSGDLRHAIGRWSIGSREGNILRMLATAKVLADNLGLTVPCPMGHSRTAWEEALQKLVVKQGWDARCSDCHRFFAVANAISCTVGMDDPIEAVRCPDCGCITHEQI